MKMLYMTCPCDDTETIVRTLLNERLIACANIFPAAQSLYWWKGEIDQAQETVVIMKTVNANTQKAIARVRDLHPYDVPSISVLGIEATNPDYRLWVQNEARPAS